MFNNHNTVEFKSFYWRFNYFTIHKSKVNGLKKKKLK